MIKTHELKCIEPYFGDVWDKLKTFEIRNNDRLFKVGDLVILKKYSEETDTFHAERIMFKIGYILENEVYLPKNHICLSITNQVNYIIKK